MFIIHNTDINQQCLHINFSLSGTFSPFFPRDENLNVSARQIWNSLQFNKLCHPALLDACCIRQFHSATRSVVSWAQRKMGTRSFCSAVWHLKETFPLQDLAFEIVRCPRQHRNTFATVLVILLHPHWGSLWLKVSEALKYLLCRKSSEGTETFLSLHPVGKPQTLWSHIGLPPCVCFFDSSHSSKRRFYQNSFKLCSSCYLQTSAVQTLPPH